jgi:hypothetical protein
MQRTGVSQEIDIGVIPSQFGYLKIWKKLSVLVPSKNFKNFQDVEKSLIFTEKTLIILQFHQRKVKESSKEFQKFLIVGSSLDLCHLLSFTILSAFLKKNSFKDSPLTLLLKVLIKLEDGFIP